MLCDLLISGIRFTDCITIVILLTISVLHDIRRAGLHLSLILRSIVRVLHSDRGILAISIWTRGRLAC